MFERVLVCLDGSKLAEQVLPYAIEVASRFRSKVFLLQVLSLPASVGARGEPGTVQIMTEALQAEEKNAKAYLEEVAQAAGKWGVDVEPVTVQAMPSEGILAFAEEQGIGLIAMSTHGRSGMGRAVFGSVADFVLRNSGRPVLLIRPEGAS